MHLALIPLLLALAAGITMALQGSLNTVLGKVVGLLEATFFVHVIGTAALVALLWFGLGQGSLARYAQAPWYAYLGGILGVAIIYLVQASISKLGVAIATTAIVVGQVSTALLIDHFGLFGLREIPFTWWKLLGLIFLATGAKLMLN
ncbi:MAG TPA: DMT family transporter [Syntrophomonadaceae bacterium]|nr:DMT family transporter [Syntrophomonadaceae bacterium]